VKNCIKTMKQDSSIQLYEKFISLTNRNVVVYLKTGAKKTCALTGFNYGSVELGEPFINSWHIADRNAKNELGLDPFGYDVGEILYLSEIKAIQFEEDGIILFTV